jgi:hypothetical protein
LEEELLLQRMCKSEKRCESEEKYAFRNGYFMYQGESGEHRLPHRMYVEKEENVLKRKRGATIVTEEKKLVRYFKGIERILGECNLWQEQDPYRQGRPWRLDCKGEETADSKCCARHC